MKIKKGYLNGRKLTQPFILKRILEYQGYGDLFSDNGKYTINLRNVTVQTFTCLADKAT